MGSVQFAPWARRRGLVVILVATLVGASTASNAGDEYRDAIIGGTFRRSDLLALLGSVPIPRFVDQDGADRNATPLSPHVRHMASRETKREKQNDSPSPPYWYPYQTGQELRVGLGNVRPQSDRISEQPNQQPDGVRQANLYPSCEGPSDMTQWHPNGRHAFQFFFPQIGRMRSSERILMPRSTTLYLRLKSPGGWRLQKSSTPSSSQPEATPNDVDTENMSLNAESTARTYVIINVTEPGCTSVICRTSVLVDLSSSYPYAKIAMRFFGLRWFTTMESEVQRIEVTATDPQTKEPLDIGDLFVGMRCGPSEPRLSLPSYLSSDPSRLEYLEGLADSFLSVDYTVRSSFSSNSDRATTSHTGLNLRDLQRFQASARRAKVVPGQPRAHHHHRGHLGRSGHHAGRAVDWPLTHTVASNADSADVTAAPLPASELQDSRLRCDKQREFLTFAAAGMPTVVEPSGFTFVSCKCTRVCAADSSSRNSCLPCESRVLASQTLTVKELENGQVVTRQRTIPTDCGCY